MPPELASRVGMGEPGGEKLYLPEVRPARSVHALTGFVSTFKPQGLRFAHRSCFLW